MKSLYSKGIFVLPLVIIILLCSNKCFPQLSQVVSGGSIYSPPSPNASALLRYANVPVDEHTGIPSVVLPIDQLSGRQLTVPITLSYHGAGNKVQDIASNVGLGFVLNAGGVITRVMRGLPDESTTGYQYYGKKVYSNSIDSVYLNATINNKIDGEPDMFYFNFLGHSGKFVVDTLGNAQYLPDQGIRVISHPIHNSPDSTNNAWVLKDFSGTTYVFGADTSSKEITVVNLAGQPITKAITYISSWYLAKVISPDGKETVNFNYSSGPNLSYEQYRNIITYYIYNDVTDKRKGIFSSKVIHTDVLSAINVDTVDVSTVIEVLNAKYLSSIQNDMGSVTFSYGSRLDVSGGQALNQIKIYNIDDAATPLKTYTFSESYFLSPHPNSPTDPDSKRLRLDCVSLQGRSTETKQLFVFSYNEQTLLPPRNSDQFDHWGYYTTTDNRAGSPPVNATADKYGNYVESFEKRVSDPTRIQACILTKVRNVNGGYTNFTYDIDDYKYDGGIFKGGGLRIKTITENDSLGQVVPIVKQYTYTLDDGTSSGMIYNPKPYYIQGITNYQAGTVVTPIPSLLSYEIKNLKSPITVISTVAEVALTIAGLSTPVGLIIDVGILLLAPAIGDAYDFLFHRTNRYHYTSPPFSLSSTPLNNLFDINGASVTYSQVGVINGDGGKTIDYYTSQQTYPDSSSAIELNCLAQGVKTIYGNSGSYPPNTSFDFERGLLKQSKAYDNNNNLVSMVTNTYQLTKRVGVVAGQRSSVSGYAVLSGDAFQVITYNFGIYKEISENIQMVQSITQLYDQTNNGASISSTNNYVWEPSYPTLINIEFAQRSDGKTLMNFTTYPTQYPAGTTFIDDMVKHYMWGVPIEKISALENGTTITITGGVVNRYKSGGFGLLDTVFSLSLANPIPQPTFKFSNQLTGGMGSDYTAYAPDAHYIAKAFYQTYDSKDNLIQSQNIGEPPSSIIWGYNQDVPVAQISNAAINQVAYTGFETNDQRYWLFTATGRDSSGLAKTGKIRYQLSAGQVKTSASMPAGTYILSFWTQGAKPTIGGTTADVSIVNGESDNHSWNFYMDRVTVAGSTQVTLTGTGFIDELRLYPQGAHISTVSIIPQVGTSSQNSQDDKVNTYEYDALLRNATVRDDQYNVLKQYSYSNVPPVPCIAVPDIWNGINPQCYTDQANIVPTIANYSAVATNSYGNIICSFTRTPADTNYMAGINYTVSFSDSTTYSNSISIKNGDLSTMMGLPLTGKSAESVSGIGIDTVINLTNNYGVAYQRYLNRQRVRDGFTEANTLTGGVGPYIAPIRSSTGCAALFSNTAQTGFYKNDCTNGDGSIVDYTVPAGTYTASSQFGADSVARVNGQLYANANGNCSAIDTTYAGVSPYCITGTADSGTPTLSNYSIALSNIQQVNVFIVTVTRTSGEAAHDATVTYTMQFNNGSTATYTTPMYKNQLSISISPPLIGYSISSVLSISVTGVVYSALNRLAYTNRQRYLNGVADGSPEANTPGRYYLAPLADPGACGTWFYNTAQTGFYKNDCAAGAPGSSVSYTVAAHTDSSMVSQVFADALAHVRGQAYANANGNCYPGQAVVSTFAGNGVGGYVDGNLLTAEFYQPTAMAIDANGTLYLADNGGTMIRKITMDGTVSTLAGSTVSGYVDATGTAARFQSITGMAVDASGNIYATDMRNFRVRKITPAGVVTTFAGSTRGYTDAQGTAAQFSYLDDITIGPGGVFYVMDGYEDNYMRIRSITPGGLVSTVAGIGTPGNVDGPYNTASFGSYQNIACDPSGIIYKGDFLYGATNGAYVRRLARDTVSSFVGDKDQPAGSADGTGSVARFSHNIGHLTADKYGNIYLADLQGLNIRKITPAGVVTTVAGGIVPGYINGAAPAARFYRPLAVVIDAAGNLYVADGGDSIHGPEGNNVIRKITFPSP